MLNAEEIKKTGNNVVLALVFGKIHQVRGWKTSFMTLMNYLRWLKAKIVSLYCHVERREDKHHITCTYEKKSLLKVIRQDTSSTIQRQMVTNI
ncbi:hypothetical protein [Coxiella burnetii]|uniref:hypothetical protein n=1 Tax=Coxiella burnetii TaxID=777 RepID=UPI0005942A53|nr:hypothetical protein [Coxiella burnetii]ATN81933.1 hypothetical protein AYO24_04255 [Coxiella burnetii]ATN83835.1 hypothetical protein AYO23_04270 [Coxiella burnetii]POZ79285.1 hypothetical protein CbuRSA461_04430 [Coxiella burnetii]